MASYNHFIPANTAPSGARDIGVFRDGKKVGRIPLGSLKPPDRSKRLYSFGIVSDPHVGEAPYGKVDFLPYCQNFASGMEALGSDPDVLFILNGGDLVRGYSTGTADEIAPNKPLMFEEHKRIVDAHAHGKPVFSVTGNHEQLYTAVSKGVLKPEEEAKYGKVNNTDGDKCFPYVGLMEECAGWKKHDENGIYLIDTYEPEGTNDIFIFLPLYRYVGGQTYLNVTIEGAVFSVEDGYCTLSAEGIASLGFNSGDSVQIRDSAMDKNNALFKIAMVGKTPDDTSETVKDVLTFYPDVFDASEETSAITITRPEIAQSQVYPMNKGGTSLLPPVAEGTLGEIYQTIKSAKEAGKRVFIVQHTDPSSYRDYDFENETPQNMFALPKSVYYGTTVFSGHTHYPFEYQKPDQNRQAQPSYRHMGFSSVHVPSVYDHCQGYIVDVYEDGIHLRGKNFSTGEDVALGTYWVNTK